MHACRAATAALPLNPLHLPSPPSPSPSHPQEAWNAIQKAHPALPVLFLSAGEDKAMVYAGVPADLSKQLSAGEWVKEALAPLGGKGGGKPTSAQVRGGGGGGW